MPDATRRVPVDPVAVYGIASLIVWSVVLVVLVKYVALIWFLAIALCGLRGLLEDPAVLRALSPTYAIDFFLADDLTAFLSLGAVVLAVDSRDRRRGSTAPR